MVFKNPFDAPPIRAATMPGQEDATGELGQGAPDPLIDSERAPPPPAGEALKVEFTGTAGEYARLWYASFLLSVVTLGVYSAWGKVALRRYLASRTLVGGVPLAYHGEALPILKGRLAAAVLIVTGWAISRWAPQGGPFVVALAIAVAPWFLLQTLAFNASNYSWRGLRFHFHAPYRQAALAVLPLLAWPAADLAFRHAGSAAGWLAAFVPALVVALLWPRMMAGITRMHFGGLRYGSAAFAVDATVKDFYKVYLRGIGAAFLAILVAVVILGTVALALGDPNLAAFLQAILYAVALATALGYARGRRFNLALHRLTVDGRIRFRSTLDPTALAKLFLRNALWVIASLGLASPWRRVRTMQERCRHVTVYADGGLGGIRRSEPPARGTLGESLAEGLNVDLSL